MGYRSHVLFAISQPEEVTLRLEEPLIPNLLSSADRIHDKRAWPDGKVYTIYEWDHVKWYESDAAIFALTNWMDAEESADNEEGFMFLRDGEEINDIEHKGSWEFPLTYGIGIDDDPSTRLTDADKKALHHLLVMVDGEWGSYMEPEMKEAYDRLKNLIGPKTPPSDLTKV